MALPLHQLEPTALRVGLAILLALVVGMASPARGQDVHYRIAPLPTDTLLQIRVTATFTGEPDGETRFALPEDQFGVSAMHEWIRDLEIQPSARLVESAPGVFAVSHAPDARVEIAYTVAYDPPEDRFIAFGPSVNAEHIHLFGSQWMARVGAPQSDDETIRDIEVSFEASDGDGTWASSYGLGNGPHRVVASDADLNYSVIAGGAYRTETTLCRGKPVVTLVYGEFELDDAAFFDLIEPIVCGQRKVFDDFDHPFYTVFITEREFLTAGAELLNSFTAFLDPGSSQPDVRGLLAHEMIHTWLPNKARLYEPLHPDAPGSRTRWFHEGFTEYLARLLLVQQELMPRSWMVERFNTDLKRLAYHPFRTLTLDGIERAGRDKQYTSVHHRLHYLRGALLALNWDTEVRRVSGVDASLLDPIRDILEAAKTSDGAISLDDFAQIFARYGVDARNDIERSLEGGIPLEPDPDAFGPDYELHTLSLPTFDPGFDVAQWVASGQGDVTGLRVGGPADRAGLQEGMRTRDSQNAAPWFDRWDPSAPIVLTVGEEGEERTFSFSASGPTVSIPVFVPVAGSEHP